MKTSWKFRLALIAILAFVLPGWGAENSSVFRLDVKSPLIPVRYKSKEEARRLQQAKQVQLQKDIERYQRAITTLLQQRKDQDGEKFHFIDFLTEYAVIDSIGDPHYVACQKPNSGCTFRFQYEDPDQWIIQVRVAFSKFPEGEDLLQLREDIGQVIRPPADKARKK